MDIVQMLTLRMKHLTWKKTGSIINIDERLIIAHGSGRITLLEFGGVMHQVRGGTRPP